MFLALKVNLPLSISETLTPKFLRISISLFTSIIFGMLEITTSLSVKSMAQIT